MGKTVRLTAAGQTFLGYARTLLATAQQAQAALQPARQISGSLRIALADSVCSTFLPGLLKRYHALCPQVELVLCTATADGMLQMLGTNQIDLAYTLDQPLLQRRHQHQRFNGRAGFERIANSPVTKIVNCRAFPVIGVEVRVTRHGEYFAGWDIDQYRCP